MFPRLEEFQAFPMGVLNIGETVLQYATKGPQAMTVFQYSISSFYSPIYPEERKRGEICSEDLSAQFTYYYS